MSEYILPLIIFSLFAYGAALVGLLCLYAFMRQRIRDIKEILLLQDTINQRFMDNDEDVGEWILMMRKRTHGVGS